MGENEYDISGHLHSGTSPFFLGGGEHYRGRGTVRLHDQLLWWKGKKATKQKKANKKQTNPKETASGVGGGGGTTIP